MLIQLFLVRYTVDLKYVHKSGGLFGIKKKHYKKPHRLILYTKLDKKLTIYDPEREKYVKCYHRLL